jgi:hypothetical protein
VARDDLSHRSDGVFQAISVASSISRTRWPEAPDLTKGQIATQDSEASISESFCQGNQQWHLGVAACAMGKHQSVAGTGCGTMKEPANRRIVGL